MNLIGGSGAVTLFLILLLGTFGISVATADDSNCQWKYKCEVVFQTEPEFICDRWAPGPPEKICPTPTEPLDGNEVGVTTFRFHPFKFPCNNATYYRRDYLGKCRACEGKCNEKLS